ncbi:MAG: KAP family P-loop domain protein [Firmicutes bacterium ADurb.Bin182]|nr:MAG: KAP family P-loop domain protein [Firmicutes bacterium ADurb.Bin182]
MINSAVESNTDDWVINKIISDNPITRSEDDTIGRTEFACSFAHQIISLDASTGNVVGVLGAWGSGKTSFINLVKNELIKDSIVVLDFNPWMFSGTEQLMQSFFTELSAQLRLHKDLSKLGDELSSYGDLFAGMGWLPLVGPWIERGRILIGTFAKLMQQQKMGVGSQRKKIENALTKIEKRIVVIIDDIDRLSTPEIRDIFKLVRLTANFPNIIYIVAFDRVRVEAALNEDGIPGCDYLEKILQVAVDLPPIPYQVLTDQTLIAINKALADIENAGPFNEQEWLDIFMEIIRPLIRNMRDVRRYAVGIRGTVVSLNGEVALADVLALEAIRIFIPVVFNLFHISIEALTTPTSYVVGYNDSPHLKSKIENIIKAAGEDKIIIQNMIKRLFPAARRHIENMHYGPDYKNEWLRERRVAHEDILHLYLERFINEHFKSFISGERAWSFMDNRDLFGRYLRSLEKSQIQSVVAALEVYEDMYEPKHVVPATIVLLNLLPELPHNRRSMYEFDAHTVIIRVIYRLIKSLLDPFVIESTIHSILPELTTLSAKHVLIQLVGYTKGVGHKLITEDAAKQLEYEWANEVKSTSPDNLLNEYDIFIVLLHAKRLITKNAEAFKIGDSPALTQAIISSARSESLRQIIGNRAVRRESRLAWNALIELFDDEDTLKQRIDHLRTAELQLDNGLLDLVDKYVNGWRPED